MPISEISATLNVTQAEGRERLLRVCLRDLDGMPAPMELFASVRGKMRNVTTGEEQMLIVSTLYDGDTVLNVGFPAVPAGRWQYEVWTVGADGTEDRVLQGVFASLASICRPSAPSGARYDAVVLLGSRNETLEARFVATTRAEEAAARAEEVKASVEDDITLLEGAKDVIERLHGEIANAVTIDASGNWVIGGVQTGKPSRGERGDNGLDADTVLRVELNSVDELPSVGDGRHIYYVKNETGYDVYIWGQGITGEATWINVGADPSNLKFATDSVAGVVMLSSRATDNTFGGGIHRDAQGKIRVDDATTFDKGAVRLTATGGYNEFEECIGNTRSITVSGRNLGNGIGVRRANNMQHGVVKISFEVDGMDFESVPVSSAVSIYASTAAQNEINKYVTAAGGEGNALSALIAVKVQEAMVAAGVVPPGAEMDYNGMSAPDGWLECNGQEVSRLTYDALFRVIGVRYGAGDGETTFNVPDHRDLVTIYPSTLGQTGGRALGSVQDAYAPNITGRFICDDWMAGKTTAYWNNSTTYKPVMDEEAEHEGCFLGVVYRGSSYSPSQYRQELIAGEDGERYSTMDTFPDFYRYDVSTSSSKTSSTGTADGNDAFRMTFNASRSSSVYKDGVTTLMPKNAAVMKIIKC